MARGYTDDELLAALRAFAAEHGRLPTTAEANDREEFPATQTFVNHFGSWNTAVAEAGFTPRKRHRSDDELLADLRRFAKRYDKRPTRAAVAADEDMAHPRTYDNRFRSWSDALDAAGLPTFVSESGD